MMRSAFTLMELLIVVAIIALLTALLFPVLSSARRKAQQVPCTSNLHQLHLAWAMYCDDYAGAYPMDIVSIYPYVRDRQVCTCPTDSFGGASRHVSRRLASPVSYFYLLSDDINSPKNIDMLRQRDPNHGVFYCVLHGNPCPTPLTNNVKYAFEGLVLRVHVDGSVRTSRVGFRCFRSAAEGVKVFRSQWQFVSDQPCPQDLLGPLCGFSEGQEVACPCGNPYP